MGLNSVFVVGWSDGGNVGLELAYAHPEQVRRLVAIGANYTHENWMAPDDSVVMAADDPLFAPDSPVMTLVRAHKEGGERRSPATRTKLDALMGKYPNFTVEQLKQIRVPVLVVVGDHDLINLDQTVTLFTSLPHAQLLVIPGASHMVPVEQPELVNREIVGFLSAPYRDLDRYYIMDLLK